MNVFSIDPQVPVTDLAIAIGSRIERAKAMINFLSTERFAELNDDIRYDYTEALRANLEEVERLNKRFFETTLSQMEGAYNDTFFKHRRANSTSPIQST